MNIIFNIQPGKLSYFLFIISYSLFSCSTSNQISKQAENILLNEPALSKGYTGISIYEPATGKYLFNYNADKYFLPSSNVKLFTLYAGMKYLGDSLVGLRYKLTHDTVYALPTGDPTYMHTGFINQPVADFFKTVYLPVVFSNENWKAEKYGSGWAWDDYNDSYMVERNAFPINGNIVKTIFNKYGLTNQHNLIDSFTHYNLEIISPVLITKSINYQPDNTLDKVIIKRNLNENIFNVYFPDKEFSFQKDIPFVTNGITTTLQILHSTFPFIQQNAATFNTQLSTFKIIKTQTSDSLFKPMMHNSDNFFAEQTLLMACNERLGYMSDVDMIDTILNSDLKDVPQKPRWVDGSGLSRYNLFTPRSFVYILNKMKDEFGMERLKVILPTGGAGTLENYFTSDSSFIFAKTGTMSNNCSLSGFLITGKGKLLIFSVLANNYQTSATPVRRAVEHFLKEIRKNY
jgi:D-alanyl-D-alanine carboxypeptidase/D-alanyl-D-alanine-endopeptidase (penicillin-binding protein 4)